MRTSASGIELVSSRVLLNRLASAKVITLAAYTLQPTSLVVEDLEAAADHGARISVALSRGFGMYVDENNRTATDLRKHGVRVHILESTTQSTHIKAAVIDGVLYLSDRNWTSAPGEELILHDGIPGDRVLIERAILGEPGSNDHLWTRKADALAAEGSLLSRSRSHIIRLSSESFGSGTAVYGALLRRVATGDRVELIVAASEYRRSRSEQQALAALAASGVNVRLSNANEKFAVDGDSFWIGSANATHGAPNQIEFGLVLSDGAIARELADQFDREWQTSIPVNVLGFFGSGPMEVHF